MNITEQINNNKNSQNINYYKNKRQYIPTISQVKDNSLSHIDRHITFVETVNCDLIKDLYQVFYCTFQNSTAYKLFQKDSSFGIKCMVLKKDRKNYELEYENPHLLLEFDKLYSEKKGDFNIFYYIYNQYTGKMYTIIINDNDSKMEEIITGIELNKGSKKHINTCIQYFRKLQTNNYIFI